jgi:adenylate cyclase
MLRFLTGNVCPSLSLLLIFAPYALPSSDKSIGDMGAMTYIFALGVAAIWVAAGIWIKDNLTDLVLRPVEEFRNVAHQVLAGDLSARLPVLRADEFGVMAEDQNEMYAGLEERQRIEETFGRHVGPQAAQWILEQDPGLGGVEAELTIFFLDIRDFTARSAVATPQQIVALLNEFLTEVVAVVDRHGGLVNKFLGDGFIALFGVRGQPDHADDAVATAREIMLHLDIINERVRRRGQAPLRIGIGIHTGPAVVGNIGSPRRTEFTALGDAVNVASRVEGLTKVVDTPVLLTAATRTALRRTFALRELPPQRVKGQPEPIPIFGLAEDALPPGATVPAIH